MQADGQDNPGISGTGRGNGQEFISDGFRFAGYDAIPAVGTSQSGFSFQDIRFVQCIIIAIAGASQAVRTALIDIHPERGNVFKVIYYGPDRAPEYAMNHLSP